MPKPPKFSPETPRHAVRMTCEVPQSKKSRTAQDVASAAFGRLRPSAKGCNWPFSAGHLFGVTGQVGCKAAMLLGGQVRCNYAPT